MADKATIKVVLKEMSLEKLYFLCYDHFPSVYGLLTPHMPAKAIISLLLTETDLSRLGRVVGLPENKPKKKGEPSIKAEQVAIVKGKAKVTGGIHFGDIKK